MSFVENGDVGMMFSEIFGNIFNRDMGGEDVKVPIELSFMEAVQGCSKNITFQTDLPCTACGGTGVPPGTRPETCKRCKGSVNLTNWSFHTSDNLSFMQRNGENRVEPLIEIFLDYRVSASLAKKPGTTRTKDGESGYHAWYAGRHFVRHSRCMEVVEQILKAIDLEISLLLSSVKASMVRRPCFPERKALIFLVDAVLSITQVRAGTQPGQKDQFVHFTVSIPHGVPFVNLTPRQRQLIEEFAKEEQRYDKGAAAGASR
ncbi:hypothetical protein HAX54_029727 [Datura stramonium]|uniref:Uncharacterized protein n=1 Tax=Datura stramonium TaxID=4076 RepID=A0ABS8RMG2_DATST|nr:hypothetical protein [Datura stramonium]